MTDLIDNGWSSDCHKAPVRVVGGTEGTNHWECTKCGQSCNATNPGIDLVTPDFKPSQPSVKSAQATIEDKLDKLIDTCLHPERNGLLIKETIAEGASYEWIVKRELKSQILAIITTETTKARIDELANAFREFNKDVPFDERLAYYDERQAALQKEQNAT